MGNLLSSERRPTFSLPRRRLSLKRSRRKSSNKATTSSVSGPVQTNSKPCPGPPNIAPPPTPSLVPPQNPAEQLEIVIALYDYTPRTEGDLTFKKDDRMIILDKRNGGWWKARNLSTNIEGYIPMNYVADETTLEAQKWYFGTYKRAEAEKLLTQCSQHSAFIVRKSETNPLDFSLSVYDYSTVKHYRIRTSANKYYITHKVKFETIQLLIQHYSTKEDGLCVKLGQPPIKGQSTPQTLSLTHSTQDEWEIPRSSIKLTKCLGEGHYGEVWQGEFNGTLAVAVKQLKPGSMSREEFLKEASVMKNLKHNKLVALYAVCSMEEPIYIIEELMDQCLNKYLQEQTTQDKTSLKDLTNMAAQVASGMQYLESKNFIHRDLAARNVLVALANSPVECKIADFGLARVLHSHDKIYEAQNVMHFPVKWTAPEAATHMKFTIKSDVWSFGVLMHEIFTFGGTPYPGMSNQETLAQVEKGYRMPCPVIMTEELYDIMLSCWKAQPAERPTFETIQWRLEDYYYNDEAGQLGYKETGELNDDEKK
ncbi:tyrosine-protein kinase SRK2-like isoform X1 [Bolinopsis microptera]|uniref:tyrosine-protein kinase SRK2-like isoform X1 n=1 Tax=Bolinopsis microptera TaxID=2820187 RepID=UPI00307A8834